MTPSFKGRKITRVTAMAMERKKAAAPRTLRSPRPANYTPPLQRRKKRERSHVSNQRTPPSSRMGKGEWKRLMLPLRRLTSC